jgi:hypothetical protein
MFAPYTGGDIDVSRSHPHFDVPNRGKLGADEDRSAQSKRETSGALCAEQWSQNP